MTVFDTFAISAIMFSPFAALALALLVLRLAGVRTEGQGRRK